MIQFNFLFTVVILLGLTVEEGFSMSKSKWLEKAEEAIEKAAPDDWKTYAKWADKLIDKDVGMKKVKQWIEQSMSIKTTAYNLEVAGDYYLKNNLPRKAVDYYIKSMNKLKEKDVFADTRVIQDKIRKALDQ